MCSHITDYYNKYGMKPYHLVNSYFSSSPSKDKRKAKAFSCYCYTCGKTNQSRLMSCLHCMFFACQAHMSEHFKSKKHYVAANLSHGKVLSYDFNIFSNLQNVF